MKKSLCIFFLLGTSIAFAQDVGISLRAYPAGQLFMFRIGDQVGERSALLVNMGYNRAERKDFGEHDNEEGGGAGGSIGYRYFLKNQRKGFFVGVEQAFWFLSIDWMDGTGPGAQTGNTKITVLQPAITGGYQYIPESGSWYGEIGVAFGREINVHTRGEEVGQGGISMISAAFGFRF